MFKIPTGQQKANFNRPIYGIVGKYTLSQGVALPYFACNLPVERTVDELKIAEQVPPSLETKWHLNELFQREIDEERVKQEIVKGYLLDPKKIKFFNSITIVLMPKGDDGKIVDDFDKSVQVDAPPIPWESTDTEDVQWGSPEATVANFGGVQFSKIGNYGRLRWDEDSVLAVAVDGQHRLWSLRKFREDQQYRGGTLYTHERETTIPIIFILLHPDAGYENIQDHGGRSIRAISRELFTDLNKNARTVDRARELILDDRSINALCVRTLLTESTSEDATDRLPLSLVRWQDDLNRFDTSYYLNSIVHLELVVDDLLNLKPPKDPMDKRGVEEFIKSINEALGKDGREIEYDGRSLSAYYNEDYCDEDGNPQTPFVRLPQQYLESAVSGFHQNFQPWIVKILMEFKPYKELLEFARDKNLIEGDFGKYFAQTSKHRNAIKEQKTTEDIDWYHREISMPIGEIDKLKENQWAFKAIFQKAILRLGKKIEFTHQGVSKHLGNVEDLLRYLDWLYDSGVLSVNVKLDNFDYLLWTFIALNAGNEKIKVSRTTEDRILSLLTLWYYGQRKVQLEAEESGATYSARELLKFFSKQLSKVQWPDCNKAYETIWEAFNTPVFFGGNPEKLSERRKKLLIRDRFEAVFAAGFAEGMLKDASGEGNEEEEESGATEVEEQA